MIEIAINRCPKGIFLSYLGFQEYVSRSGNMDVALEDVDRSDPVLIKIMRENPGLYGGLCAHIAIIEVPDGFPWKVESVRGIGEGIEEWVTSSA